MHVDVPTAFVEKTTLSPLNILLLSQRSVDYICVALFLGSLFCSTDVFFYQYHTLLITVALYSLKLGCVNPLKLIFVLAILGFFTLPYKL